MNRSLCFVSVFCIFAAGIQVYAQDQQAVSGGTMPGFRRRALVLDINVRVLENEQVVWRNEETLQKFTVPGSPVGIQLVGSNLALAVQFTPLIRRSGSMLLAHGQIWIDDPERGICYYTSIQSIPMDFNEEIYFFPLGGSLSSSSIEIVITVNPYRETSANTEGTAANTNDQTTDNQEKFITVDCAYIFGTAPFV